MPPSVISTPDQREPRSFLLPGLLALVALALAAAIAIHFYPATSVNVAHIHTDLLPQDVAFKSDSIVTGVNQTEHVLYIASTIRVDNQLRVPVFLDDFHLTFTNPDGAELTAAASTRPELSNIEVTFPALKPLLATPLLRETAIEPGKSAQGTLLFALNIPQSMWDARKSAIIQVGLYHQPAVYVTIPLAH